MAEVIEHHIGMSDPQCIIVSPASAGAGGNTAMSMKLTVEAAAAFTLAAGQIICSKSR